MIFNGRQNQIQFNSATDFTVRNPQFLADGSSDPNRSRPNQAGFGAANGAMGMRSFQARISFSF